MEQNSAIIKLIINVVLMLVAVLSVWSDIRKWQKAILITLGIAFIGINYYLDYNSNSEASLAQKSKKQEQSDAKKSQDSLNHINDSLTHIIINKADSFKNLQLSIKDTIKMAIDSSYIHSIAASNKALGKYGIQLQDSLRSIKMKAFDPVLTLAPIEKEVGHAPIFQDSVDHKPILKIQFISTNGTSYFATLKYYIHYHNYNILDSGYLLHNHTIVSDITFTSQLPIPKSVSSLQDLLISIKGVYYDEYNEIRKKNSLLFSI